MLFFGLSVCESVIDSGRRIILSRGRVKNADVIVASDLFVRKRRTTGEQDQPDQKKRSLREGGGNHQNANSVSILQLAHRISQS